MLVVVIVCILVLLVVGVVIALQSAGKKAQAQDATDRVQLIARGSDAAPTMADEGVALRLPPPLVKYLDLATPDEETGVRVAVLRQRGTIRSELGDQGSSFEAEQVYSMKPPGFLWLAKTAGMPPVVVRDHYIDGEGLHVERYFGAFAMDDESRGPEIDQAAALRYWCEVMAFPEMVTHPSVEWDKVSDDKARLFARHGEQLFDVVVSFGTNGFPKSFHAERFREVGSERVLTPWSAVFSDWEIIDGRLFPRTWESIWHLSEGDLTAVKMEILSVRIE